MALPTNIPARHAYILDAVRTGRFDMEWTPLVISEKGHTIHLQVSREPMRVDNTIFGAGAGLGQQIGDTLGARLVTSKIKDLMYAAAVRKINPITIGNFHELDGLPPMTLNDMEKTEAFERHTALCDRAIAAAGGRPSTGIIMSLEKSFILSNQASAAHGVNYGWYVNVPYGTTSWLSTPVHPSVTRTSTVIQQPGTYHGLDQDDYASGTAFVRTDIGVDGHLMALDDALRDPELSPILSVEGPLHWMRQPGVAQLPMSQAAVMAVKGSGGVAAAVAAALGAAAGAALGGVPGALGGAALGYAIERRIRARRA